MKRETKGCDPGSLKKRAKKLFRRRHYEPVLCPQENCGMRLRAMHDLRDHMRKHTGERPYKCSVQGCSATYAWRSGLFYHRQNKHGLFISDRKKETPGLCSKSAETVTENVSKSEALHTSSYVDKDTFPNKKRLPSVPLRGSYEDQFDNDMKVYHKRKFVSNFSLQGIERLPSFQELELSLLNAFSSLPMQELPPLKSRQSQKFCRSG